MNKKGVSPLVATVLLIAFSVALAAVVMSFGETYIEEKAEFISGAEAEFAASECDIASLSIIRVKGETQVCYRDTYLEIFFENGPSVEIEDIQSQVVGTGGVSTEESILTQSLKKAFALKTVVPYDESVGTPLQLKLVPKVKSGKSTQLCSEQALIVEDISAC